MTETETGPALTAQEQGLLKEIIAQEDYPPKEKVSAHILLDLHDQVDRARICECYEIKKASITVCLKRWNNYRGLVGSKPLIGASRTLSESQIEQLEEMLTAHGVKDLDRVRAHILLLLHDGCSQQKIVTDYSLTKVLVGRVVNWSDNQIESLIFTYYKPIFSEESQQYIKKLLRSETAGHNRKQSAKLLMLMSAGMNDAEIARTTGIVRNRVKHERLRIFKYLKYAQDSLSGYFTSSLGEDDC